MGFLDKLLGRTKDAGGKATDVAGDATDKAKDLGSDAADKAKDVAGDVAGKADVPGSSPPAA